MRYPISLLIIGFTLAACGQNGAGAAQGKGDISRDRSSAFKSFMPNVSSMRKMANGDDAFNPEKFKTAATQFAKEARVPFESFQNDPNGNGDALPNIWQKPVEFKAEQEQFFAAVDALNAAAQTEKLDDIKAAFAKVENSCQSCHQTYRAPK